MAAPGRGSGLYLRVGLLILAGIALAVGFVMFFTAGRLNRHSEIFETYFRESVQGLDVGAPVRYRGVDLDGQPVGTDASGFHAGVVQHENDHLDGILYPMRMTDFRLFGFNEELARASALPSRT